MIKLFWQDESTKTDLFTRIAQMAFAQHLGKLIHTFFFLNWLSASDLHLIELFLFHNLRPECLCYWIVHGKSWTVLCRFLYVLGLWSVINVSVGIYVDVLKTLGVVWVLLVNFTALELSFHQNRGVYGFAVILNQIIKTASTLALLY